MIDIGRIAAFQLPVLAHHFLGAVGHHQHRGHAELVRHHEVAGEILEHRRFRGIDAVDAQELVVGLRRRLRLQFGGDDVEHRLEMLGDAEPLQHRAGMVGRAVGQDQLAAGKFCDRRAHRGVGLQRRMIDLVHVGQIIVGVHAVLGHHAAHAGAVAAVIVLLDHAGFFRGDLEKRADEFADPRIDLLPQIDVMRVQRVVEIEHPGVDVAEGAGGCSSVSLSLNPSSRRTPGPIRRGDNGSTVELPSEYRDSNAGRWLWVPAFAGTTIERGPRSITASQIESSCRRSTCRPAQSRSAQARGCRNRPVRRLRTCSRACTALSCRPSSAACP